MTAKPDPDKSPDDRREQLLAAAAQCFVKSGLHGARMAQIAKQAQMSPGHIYHYFPSKKDIIAAIIQEHVSMKKDLLHQYEGAGDRMVDLMIENVEKSVEINTDLFWSTMLLEMAAEATRNEEISSVVRDSDADMRAALLHNLRGGVNQQDIEARFDVIIALMQGLGLRQILHPEFDKQAVMKLVQQIVEMLFRPQAADDREPA